MHMIRKGQLLLAAELCPARQFYPLAELTNRATSVPFVHWKNLRQNPLKPALEEALREWKVSPRLNKTGVGDDDPTNIEPLLN